MPKRVNLNRMMRRRLKSLTGAATLSALMMASTPTCAADLGTYDGWNFRWDNTLKFSSGIRLSRQSQDLIGGPNNVNTDDGDRSVNKGQFYSNRFDLLSEFDITRGDFGFSASAAAWYDAQYNGRNSNRSAATFNSYDTRVGSYSRGARQIEGKDAEILNAFIHGAGSVDGHIVTWRAGRYALIWGESLFAADEGVAYGMAPVDVIKAAGVPNTQAKELFLPQTQVSASFQISQNLSLEVYNQFEFRPTRGTAVGSYYSASDIIGAGAEDILFAPRPAIGSRGPPFTVGFDEGPLKNPPSAFQSNGIALHFTPEQYDFGIYALQFTNHVPQAYLDNSRPHMLGPSILAVNTLQGLYQRHIQLYGISANHNVGAIDFGAELSARVNTDLNSTPQPISRFGDPGFAIGNTLHFLVNAVYIGKGSRFYDGITVLAEVAGAHLLAITKDKTGFSSDARHTAVTSNVVFIPAFYQVLPSVDIDVPIGFAWDPAGRSPVSKFVGNGTVYGSSVSAGVAATYRNVWHANVNYTQYFGKNTTQPSGFETNPFADRKSLSFAVLRSF